MTSSRPATGILATAGRRFAALVHVGWGLADQVVVAGFNFAGSVLLARTMEPESFGLYVVVLGVLLLATSLQFSLIGRPHNVLGAQRTGEEYARYTTASAAGQGLFIIVATIPAVLIAVVAGIAGWAAAPLLVAAVPALIATQCHEFGRRVLYTERRLPAVVLVDGIYYAGQVLAFLGLWYGGLLTGATAFLALAGAATLSTVVGLSLIWRNFVGTVDTALMRENWRFGKWLLGATVGDWLASQVITYLSALLLGAAAAAVLKAGSLLIGPVNVLLGFVDSVLPTRFAVVWRDGGKPALTRQMLQAYRFSAPVIVGYSLLVAVFATPLLRLLYGDTYAGYGSVVVLMAVLCATSYLPRILSAALQARGLTRPVFLAYMAAGFVMVGPSVALIKLLGVHGSVLGSIAGTLITFTVLAIQYRRGSAAMAAETSARADRPVQRMATPAAATASHSSGDA